MSDELKVFDKGSDCIICDVINGGNINDYCSVNILDTYINIPFLRVKDTKDIENMTHWAESADMAEHLYVLIDNDHI